VNQIKMDKKIIAPEDIYHFAPSMTETNLGGLGAKF
jgi:hypothetical protein|tara:strand:- start:1145 stop:1252 length:108 start_codon:yes stop_codon:yes gene_type:complete